ncbi:hypothetical protein CEE37_05030 [candidate division LCP-89 bacterium B3_LCP]|uniref:Secretion system C-terminal sorting domain-containing protein n=1 Tax=candidate division LCP-89 bacterium B3_LCP TaxID=2012998 RepID=A0A532V1F3_UNCL8|nr:MAG: hypothetical protein CEE37_05030 [candidate division LCP-89 bacterium B3_LCP]
MNRAYCRGGGFFAYSCSPTLINNTIVRNRSTYVGYNSSGAVIYVYSGASVTGRNNIVYDNFATNNPNIYGTTSFIYSCIQGGMSGIGNISSDPLFVHNPPLGFSYLCQIAAGQPQDSPCMDAGDPNSPLIQGTTRTDQFPDVGIVDMGFHWWLTVWSSALSSQLEHDLFDKLSAYSDASHSKSMKSAEILLNSTPNPFNPRTTLSFELPSTGLVNLSIYDISGKMVTTLVNGWRGAGINEVTFDGRDLSSGVYVYLLEAGDFKISGKMVLMK